MESAKAKELAAIILKIGEGRVYIDPANVSKVAEAMTKDDVRSLIAERVIQKRPSKKQSMGRARIRQVQKDKGRGRGKGNRAGTKKTRTRQRLSWIGRVRSQRRTLKELKTTHAESVNNLGYSKLYKMVKGNYFRGKKHLVDYVEGAKK
ncbi:MAG: 50S ribosomal protein L19e [archaeon]|jgi:large subunit ribosomal protein L19e